MSIHFGRTFAAVRGVQAGREYYVSMCSLRTISQIFMFDEEELPPELRAQRSLNKNRIPEMMRYVVDNSSDYTFSALTVSIDGEIEFAPFEEDGDAKDIGRLKVSDKAKYIINDGQHRQAAIEAAIREKPEIAEEAIAVVFFLDIGLERSKQMFSDLNKYAIRPSRSLNILYDNRDQDAVLTKELVFKSTIFKNVVEMEKSNLAKRSGKLFTLSAIHSATQTLFSDLDIESDAIIDTAIEFWAHVDKQIPEWKMVRDRDIPASEVREGCIHSHAVVLHAIGRVGNSLLEMPKAKWKKHLRKLKTLDWSRTSKTWSGRAVVGGAISKTQNTVILTNNAIKQHIGLELTPEEQRVEDAYKLGEI